MPDNVVKLRPSHPCPICSKPSVHAFRPFCSPRCKDVDLNRWLSGAYVIPAEGLDGEDDVAETAGGADDEH